MESPQSTDLDDDDIVPQSSDVDGERRRLVSQSPSEEKSESDEEVEEEDDDSDRSQQGKESKDLEGLLDSTGYGFFHVLLTILTGIALATDAIEVLGVAFIVPIAGKDLDLTANKSYLDASVFVGQCLQNCSLVYS